jgi:hypothetical protein
VYIETWLKQTSCAVGSDWLTVKGMEGTMRDVVEVYCTVISRNYERGTEEEHEVPQDGLGTSSHRNG